MTDDAEKPEGESPADLASYWIAELGVSEKFQAKWVQRARKITKRYESDAAAADTKRRYSMLWSNTQTIMPAMYSRPPQPVVSRRFKDEDPVGRLASEVLERALSYSVDKQDMDGILRLCTQDYALIARSQVWERYVPTHGPAVVPKIAVSQVSNDPTSGYQDEDGNEYGPEAVQQLPTGAVVDGEAYEPIVYEESITDHLCWEDFGFGPARSWDEVPYVWRRVYMDRKQLKARFGDEVGAKVPLDWGKTDVSDEERERTCKAAIYEIWDKCSKRAVWISKGYPAGPLDDREDPLGLDGFFPCPRPLFGTMAPGKMNPVPDYIYYVDQAEEIDTLTGRIAELQSSLKVRGFYAGDMAEDLNNLLLANNNALIPVSAWKSVSEAGGVRGKIEWWPLDQVVSALKACIDLRAQLIDDVYQITGVSDIQRGSSDPRETAAAQGIKANFGSLRIRDRQNEIVRFARDILRIKGEVIAEQFGIDTLKAITGLKIPTAAEKQAAQLEVQKLQFQFQAQAAAQAQGGPGMGSNGGPPMIPPELEEILSSPTWEDVVALLKDNALRQFRIDIETDSTIEPNESEQKARMVEFVSAVGGFFGQIGPLVAQAPETAPMFGEIIKAAVRQFRAGREVEAAIERTMDKVLAGPAPSGGAEQPPPPDKMPVEVAQINLQREQVKQQGENQRAQLEAQVAQGDQQVRMQDQQIKTAVAPYDADPQVSA